MKKLAIAMAALMLAGCASAPKPSTMPKKPKAAVVQVAPVEQPTPNQTVKKRWFDRFLKHKSK